MTISSVSLVAMGEPEKSTKVLLVDDDSAVLRFLESVIRKQNYLVLLARDGEEALDQAVEHSPHLVILDLSLPRLNGLDVLSRLRGWYRAPILVLSGHGEEETIVKALETGADDYLTKPVRPRELLARIGSLLRRASEQPARQAVITAGDLQINLAARQVFRAGEEVRLTRTEFAILSFLAQNQDCVVTFQMLLNRIWGPTHGNYAQSLRVHIGNIRRKLDVDHSVGSPIRTESGVGYRFSVPEKSLTASQ